VEVELIDGRGIARLLRDGRHAVPSKIEMPDAAFKPSAPACPVCTPSMLLRTATRGSRVLADQYSSSGSVLRNHEATEASQLDLPRRHVSSSLRNDRHGSAGSPQYQRLSDKPLFKPDEGNAYFVNGA
jgi:hypothetical protein